MTKQLSVKRLKGQKLCSKSLSNKKRTFNVLFMYGNLSWQLIFTNQKDFEFVSKWMKDIEWKPMDIWFMFKWRFTVRSHNLSPTLTNHPWKGELGWTIVPVGKFRKLAKSSSGPSMVTRLERTWTEFLSIKCFQCENCFQYLIKYWLGPTSQMLNMYIFSPVHHCTNCSEIYRAILHRILWVCQSARILLQLIAFLNKGATPPWARVCGRSPAVPSSAQQCPVFFPPSRRDSPSEWLIEHRRQR